MPSVSLNLLMQSIRFARFAGVEMRGSERTDHSDVDGETAMETPALDGDVSRSTTGAVSYTQKT